MTIGQGMDWVTGFIDNLYTSLGTTCIYNATAVSTLPQFTVKHTSALTLLHSPLIVSWQRIHNCLTLTAAHYEMFSAQPHSFLAIIHKLPTPKTPSILCYNCHLFSRDFAELDLEFCNSTQFSILCAWDTHYIAWGGPHRKKPLPLLFRVDSLLQRCVYSAVA
jgi:hypothetical protein